MEIETGFIPPENALSPLTYTTARLASKIIRYSSFAGKFALGVPPHYILPFPRTLAKPPRNRTDLEIEQIKALCDAFYQKPPVTLEEIRNARIHEVYIIDVDHARVQEIDPEAYLKRAMQKGVVFDCLSPEVQEHDDLMSFYVYILQCCDGSYYTGYTKDLEERTRQHQTEKVPGTLKPTNRQSICIRGII